MFRRDHRAEALAVRIDHLMTSVVLPDDQARLGRADRQPASFRRTSAVDSHHHYFRYRWERVERGAVVMSGWIFGSLDESEAIDRIVAFEGLEPAVRE